MDRSIARIELLDQLAIESLAVLEKLQVYLNVLARLDKFDHSIFAELSLR